MSLLKPNEWEVASFEYLKDDKHYKVVVTKFTKTDVRNHNMDREVRLPFKPRIGQILTLPKLN